MLKLGIEPRFFIVQSDMSDEQAMNLEMSLIKQFGRQDKKTGILLNHTDGGEGCSGLKWSKESRESKKGINHPYFQRGDLLTGNKNGFYGKRHSKEWKEHRKKTLGAILKNSEKFKEYTKRRQEKRQKRFERKYPENDRITILSIIDQYKNKKGIIAKIAKALKTTREITKYLIKLYNINICTNMTSTQISLNSQDSDNKISVSNLKTKICSKCNRRFNLLTFSRHTCIPITEDLLNDVRKCYNDGIKIKDLHDKFSHAVVKIALKGHRRSRSESIKLARKMHYETYKTSRSGMIYKINKKLCNTCNRSFSVSNFDRHKCKLNDNKIAPVYLNGRGPDL